MPNETRPFDEQPLELIPDSPYESWHEFVEELAYALWVNRGRPLGSPDIDWFKAEQAVYASLLASGMINPQSNGPQNMEEAIYH